MDSIQSPALKANEIWTPITGQGRFGLVRITLSIRPDMPLDTLQKLLGAVANPESEPPPRAAFHLIGAKAIMNVPAHMISMPSLFPESESRPEMPQIAVLDNSTTVCIEVPAELLYLCEDSPIFEVRLQGLEIQEAKEAQS